VLGLNLWKEFQGPRLRGPAIQLANEDNTGATQATAVEFLDIPYPSSDLLKALEPIGPSKVAAGLIGERGQEKSHLRTSEACIRLGNPDLISENDH